MIALWLLGSHLVGDFLLQTRWQSAGKFGWSPRAMRLRNTHCFTYTLAFLPATLYAGPGWGATGFLVCLYVLHYLTDAQRFERTPGEMVAWWAGANDGSVVDLERNPWPGLPLAIDQTLHVVQLAVLGALFLT